MSKSKKIFKYEKKKILLVTERRADFSRFKPILDKIKKDKNLDYILVVTGIHLLRKYGYSVEEIKTNLKFIINLRCIQMSLLKMMMEHLWFLRLELQ